MKKVLVFCLVGLAVGLQACYKNNLETLSGNAVCVTENMSYQNDIKVIINASCALSGCHDANASTTFSLTAYDDVKMIVDDQRFLKSIRHESGVSQMPKSASKLSECNINKIAAWINAGALDN